LLPYGVNAKAGGNAQERQKCRKRLPPRSRRAFILEHWNKANICCSTVMAVGLLMFRYSADHGEDNLVIGSLGVSVIGSAGLIFLATYPAWGTRRR